MSQDYHHHHHHPNPNIYAAFSNEFEGRPSETNPTSTTTTVDPTYETAGGMLSEMFNFGPTHPATSANNNNNNNNNNNIIIDSPPHHHHHHHQWPPPYGAANNNNNNNSAAAAMQLFLTHAPPPPPPSEIQGGFYSNVWGGGGELSDGINNNEGGQGLLSLSLSSSLAAKQAEDNQINQINQIMFFNQHQHQHQSATNTNTNTNTTASSSGNNNDFFKNLSGTPGLNPMTLHNMEPVGGFVGPSTSSVGFGSASTSAAMGVVNVLRNSKYAKPAQELLEEFCSVGRGSSHQLKKPKVLLGSRQNSSSNMNPSTSGGGGGGSGGGSGGGGGGSSSKEGPQLAPSERIEHQRRKVKLLAMLDEVDKRYNNYCSQMQMVVNSFDLVMGYGGAIPYTALAQKAMSRHFRCLKDAIHMQLKHSCERLGEKDPTATSGLTKGETPRLKMLEQSLRQQRAFHQMGMMDQDAWRPQRGLPDRSVNILRAWLFEHFLHPYPSDADKHLLARQTGLSRNQVSNWFINARVRLWKPMVEEMYQQESKDDEDEEENDDEDMNSPTQTSNNNSFPTTQPQPQPQPQQPQQLQVVAQNTIHRRHQHPANVSGLPSVVDDGDGDGDGDDDPHHAGPTTMISFGGPTGDVSLTLGLHHAGDNNAHDKSVAPFELIRDCGSC